MAAILTYLHQNGSFYYYAMPTRAGQICHSLNSNSIHLNLGVLSIKFNSQLFAIQFINSRQFVYMQVPQSNNVFYEKSEVVRIFPLGIILKDDTANC